MKESLKGQSIYPTPRLQEATQFFYRVQLVWIQSLLSCKPVAVAPFHDYVTQEKTHKLLPREECTDSFYNAFNHFSLLNKALLPTTISLINASCYDAIILIPYA